MTLQQKQEVNSVTDLPFIKHFSWSSQQYTETEWQHRETSRHKSHDTLWCDPSLLFDMGSMMSGHHECCTIKTTAWLFKVHNDNSHKQNIKMAFFCCNIDHMTTECVYYITFIMNKWNDGLLGLITSQIG